MGGRVHQRLQWTVLASAGGPVAGHPFAAGVGGMEWYGRSQAGPIRVVDRATRVSSLRVAAILAMFAEVRTAGSGSH